MKKSVYLILIILLAFQEFGYSQKSKEGFSFKKDTVSADSVEYRLIIFDTGFETWLIGKPPVNFYSNDYYRIKNRFYVSEWNLRYQSGNDNGLYDNYIDYNPLTDYGIDINYRLYYYFKYFEATNHVQLIATGR
jgi:hypothetical protein